MNISYNKQIDTLVRKMDRWLESLVSLLPNIFFAFITLLLFYFIGKLIRGIYINIFNRFSDNKVVNRIMGTGIFILLCSIGIAASLSILRLDKAVYSLLAGAGVIGLALGFAFQEIASNFISGILIAFNKPYNVGDIVEVKGYIGEVTTINLRTTSIETYQGLEVIVPNKDLFTQVMVNYSSTLKRRIDLKIGVSYHSDLELVEKVTRRALKSVSGRLERYPIDVFFYEFGQSSINLSAQIWVRYPGNRSYYQSLHECITSIKSHYEQNHILIPFPITTLDFSLSGKIDDNHPFHHGNTSGPEL
jgi:small conductance mechanosensitive channel